LIRRESGFTMIELLVAMPIMLVIMGGLVLMLTTVTHWSGQTQEEVTLQTEARAALNRLEAEIRGTFVDDGSSPIITATATSITFDTPDTAATTVSGSTESSFHLMQVSYKVASGTLQRQFKTTTNTFPGAPPWTWPANMGPWATVVGSTNSITNSDVFTYYNAAGAQAAPPTPLSFPIADTSGIVAVGVKLTLSTGGSQPTKFTVRDTIAIRGADN
jgi:prepilin-type N-terminal cleavage/methylation domain-containing protein